MNSSARSLRNALSVIFFLSSIACLIGCSTPNGPDASDAAVTDSSPDRPASWFDSGADVDADLTFDVPDLEAAACAGLGPVCAVRVRDRICDTEALDPICDNGRWSCPEGTIDVTLCECHGDRPGCECRRGDWDCSDAGAGDTGVVRDSGVDARDASAACVRPDASVDAPMVPDGGIRCSSLVVPWCFTGTVAGRCEPGGAPATCTEDILSCLPGTVPLSLCACYGDPPAGDCTCEPTGWACRDAMGMLRPTPTFQCGDRLNCHRDTEFCAIRLSPPPTPTRRFSCEPVPMACRAGNCADCFAGIACCSSRPCDDWQVNFLSVCP